MQQSLYYHSITLKSRLSYDLDQFFLYATIGDIGYVSVYGVIVLDNLTGVILIRSIILISVDWCTGVMISLRNDDWFIWIEFW